MKRILQLMLLPVVIFAMTSYSCTQEPKPDPKPDPDDNKEGTYKFVASPLKEKWVVGDQIYVHGSLGSMAQTITLTADDISSDGKTASAYLGDITEYTVDPDGLYAAYPADAVKRSNGVIGSKTTFTSCETMLMTAYLKDDTFTFKDASAQIAFSIKGDYDAFAIAAGDRNGINVTRLEVEHTSEKFVLTPKQNDGYPFKYGDVESGKTIKIWMPGDMTLKDGFNLYFGKDGNWTARYSVAKDTQLTAGDCLDLGDLSSSVTAYNGPAPKMPVIGKSTQYSVQFNELSGICLSEDNSFLWGVGDDGELARLDLQGKVLSNLYIDGDAEDVTRNPLTGDLLIGWEDCSNGQGVAVVKAPDFNKRAQAMFSIPAAKNYGNAGVEGLTYYKDGMVFAGTQQNSHLFLCDLDTKSVLWSKMLYDKARVSEIAGLSYDPLTGWLWIIDSEAKKIFVYAVDHSINDKGEWDVSMDYLGAYPVSSPGNPESVCVDHGHGCVWVGDDAGETSYLYKYEMTGLDDANKD